MSDVSRWMNLFKMLKGMFTSSPRRTPLECAAKIRAGEAFLVDVREPNEWVTGVAENAVLLSLADLAGSRKDWTPFLAAAGSKEIVLYCGAGVRSGMAARVLTSEGFRAINSGSLMAWQNAGWPIVKPAAGATKS